MIRIYRTREITLMACIAIRSQSFELPILMTGRARRRLMGACQHKIRFIMVEHRRPPPTHCMAGQTVAVELRRLMVRLGRLVVGLLVAGEALARESRIDIVRMANAAGDGSMGADQLEVRLRMLER